MKKENTQYKQDHHHHIGHTKKVRNITWTLSETKAQFRKPSPQIASKKGF